MQGDDHTCCAGWSGAPDQFDPVGEDLGTVRGTAGMERLNILVAATSRGRPVHAFWERVDEDCFQDQARRLA